MFPNVSMKCTPALSPAQQQNNLRNQHISGENDSRLPSDVAADSPRQSFNQMGYQSPKSQQYRSGNHQYMKSENAPIHYSQKMTMPLAGLSNIQKQNAPNVSAPVAIPAIAPSFNEESAQNPLMNALPFSSYWPEDLVIQLAQRGMLIMGPLRVNQRDYTQSFVPHPTEDVDVAIPGTTLRNGALDGDICAVQMLTMERALALMPQNEQQAFMKSKNTDDNGDNIRTSRLMYGRVVRIMKNVHSRICAGILKNAPSHFGEENAYLLSPVDSRIPRLLITDASIPASVRASLSRYSDMLFIAEITEWSDVRFARGKMRQQLGMCGDLKAESDAILWSIGIDPIKAGEFSPEVLACLPAEDWQPPQSEVGTRLDLRQACVFTCDPATARDLDDAVSCELLPCGVYEVGVHIADVSYFVREGTALDEIASQRATSVYLAERMVPMLPLRLSADLCSLNPGVDRLTFSVIWHLDASGNILSEWIGRTIIRSALKLNYEAAMDLIDGKEGIELPQIYGNFNRNQIVDRLKWLHGICQNLRQRRFASGAITLDQIKLKFSLAPETGAPIGFQPYKRMASNELIEELMLLANMSVAQKLHKTYPDLAVLRRHPPPQKIAADRLIERFSKLGIQLDFTTSGTLSASINRLSGVLKTVVLNSVIRINQLAVYCRSDSSNFTRHYALACDFYTHFTSPIRRYADVLVHRQLAAACYGIGSPGDCHTLDVVLRNCNDRKKMARMAGDDSSKLYYSALLREAGCMYDQGVVIGVLDRAFDVLVMRTGMTARIYTDALFAMFDPNAANQTKSKNKQQQSQDGDMMARYSKNDESLEIHIVAPLDVLEQYRPRTEDSVSAKCEAREYVKLVNKGGAAAITILIRPLVVVDIMLRHVPKKEDPLRWDAVLNPGVFLMS